MLPPSFQKHHPHQYGQLIIKVKPQINIALSQLSLYFFGNSMTINRYVSNVPIQFHYKIVTNLWHFYAYLKDCSSILLYLYDNQHNRYSSKISFTLQNSQNIINSSNFNSLFTNNSYLCHYDRHLTIYNQYNQQIGYCKIQLNLNFEEDINKLLFNAGLISLQQILSPPSPISSTTNLTQRPFNLTTMTENQAQLQPRPITQIPESKFFKNTIQQKDPVQLKSQIIQYNKRKLQNNIQQQQFAQEKKLVQDQIQKLIAEMQNQPYDASKYLESKQTIKQQKYIYDKHDNSFSNTTEKPIEKIFNKTVSHSNYHKNNNYSPNLHLSPYKNNTISNVSPYSKNNYTIVSNLSPYSKTINVSNRTINISQQNRHNRSSVVSQKRSLYPQQGGTITIIVHQLLLQQIDFVNNLILRAYVNDNSDECFSVTGLKKGQNIDFNGKFILKQIQRQQIQKIRFQILDNLNQNIPFLHGIFQTKRLHALTPCKGSFLINMKQGISKPTLSEIKVMRSQVRMVLPSLKSLRIQAEYEQKIQIIQMYLSLSKFVGCTSCRYKIPFTQQPIQFQILQLKNSTHINVFPHNRSLSSNLIIQFWNNGELVGLQEISLKKLINTNINVITTSLEPVYLYDEDRQFQGMKGKKIKFNIVLCCGNVKQIQGLLNKPAKISKISAPLQVKSHLGIYIKERPSIKQAQTQVEQNEMISRKQSMKLQQQEQDEPEIQKQSSQKLQQSGYKQNIQQAYEQQLDNWKQLQRKYEKQNNQEISFNTEQQQNSFLQMKIEERSKSVKQQIKQKQQTNYQQHTLSIEGLQNCVSTAECLMNLVLNRPKLIIKYINSIIQISNNDQPVRKVTINTQGQEYLQGIAELIAKQGPQQLTVARCSFSLLRGVRSVYTMKSIQNGQYCGLIYLQYI